LSSVRRSNGVGDAFRHLVRRTDMLPEFGSIIFWRFATLWQDALLHSGPAPAIRLLRRPSPAAKPAVGMPIPELSDRLREKACPSLLNIKLYCIVYIRRCRDDRRDRARKVAELAEICGRQHNA